jgi:hypothetical protein
MNFKGCDLAKLKVLSQNFPAGTVKDDEKPVMRRKLQNKEVHNLYSMSVPITEACPTPSKTKAGYIIKHQLLYICIHWT